MTWTPPAEITYADIEAASRHAVSSGSQDECVSTEYLFRIQVAGLPWDIAGRMYEPLSGDVAVGPDGRQIGALIIHGGGEDHRSSDTVARLFARLHNVRVVTVSHPGNLYLRDDSHDWPGDTMEADGTVRVPMWAADEVVERDQYEVVEDKHDPVFRAKYGTLFFAKALEGSRLYDRLASWPWAYEVAFVEVCKRFLPDPDFSVYVSGHSTGGPFAHMCLQRVPNAVGLIGAESTPFGGIFSRMLGQDWPYPFSMMTIRTWRDVARYMGPEAGVDGAMRLPWLMEEVFERHRSMQHLPLMKMQHLVQFAAVDELRRAAAYTAGRVGMNAEESAQLEDRFAGYPYPLPEGPPVPPLLYSIMGNSRDHTYERYSQVLLPALAEIEPAPRTALARFAQGVHYYHLPLGDLPFGTAPAIVQLWADAIGNGFYLP